MIIDKQLNLVIPILRGDQTQLYVHSTPIRPETFETYYLVLSKTWSAIMANGLDARSAPSMAALMLKDVAKNTPRAPGVSWFDGPDGVGGEAGLLAEMARLSNAIVPTPDKGWTTLPLQAALDQKLVSDEEAAEVSSQVAFFILCSSRAAPRVDRDRLVRGQCAIYESQTTYYNATEFANSLKTSTADETTGGKAQP